MSLAEFTFSSPLGNLQIRGDKSGISELNFLDITQPISPQDKIPEVLKVCVKELKAYLEGNLKEFSCQLNLKGTDFQKEVWENLREIPFGKSLSYLEGNIKAIRAVASANGKNPIPIIIPCYRVIGSDGSLTGYSGGLWRKEWLLKHEQIIKQTSLF